MTMFSCIVKGFGPDIVTYTTLMKAFIRAKKFDKVPSHSLALLAIIKECVEYWFFKGKNCNV